ncbi:MAG: HD domain-containing phosphohydrolase [Candidatus Xenobia bacterium]
MSEEARILVISADAAVQETFARVAAGLGHDMARASSGLEAVERARSQGFDLIVADRRLSDLEGLTTLAAETDARPSAPVILIGTEESDADEYLGLPLQEREVRRSIRRSLERRRSQQQFERLLQQQWRDASRCMQQLAARVEAADPYFKGHAQRVAELSGRIGRRLKLPRKGLEILDLAAWLHDVGTLDEKLDAVRQAEAMQDVFRIIVHHHEWYDGSGRPAGLKAEQIPLEARILCIAEAYDAMVSPRPHRDRLSRAEALEIVRQESGSHFDPDIVAVFEQVLDAAAVPTAPPPHAPTEKRRAGLLLSLAHTYLQNGNLDVALKAYEECLEVIGETRVAARAEAWNGVAMIHLQRGYLGAARTAVAEALAASQGISELQAARSQCLEAMLDAQQGRVQDAEHVLGQAAEVFEGWESRADIARVHLLRALIYQHDDAVCRQKLLDALAYLADHDLAEVPVRERTLFAPLFLKAFSAGWEADQAVAPFLLRFGPGGLAPWLSAVPAAAASRVKALLNTGAGSTEDDISIYCFGRFRVFCGGREIPDEAWKTRKSRYLFAYLTLQEGDREVSDDRLLELFWPDHEREKARQSLYAALSHVRRALETGLPEGMERPGTPGGLPGPTSGPQTAEPPGRPGRFPKRQKVVLAHKGSYRISPDLRSRVDVLEFERHYAAGREALRQERTTEAIDAFQRAETLYGGVLLEGYDSEWALHMRDEAERHYQDILTRLMDHFADKQRMQVVADYAQRLLSMDPCQQAAHSHLMRAYVALGRPELAVRQYHLCCQVMKDELNLSPSAEISNLYLSLRR